MNRAFIPKEISWLSFNDRVLQEAGNESVSLSDRLKFLGIYSNNLDEYFRVRVATLRRLSLLGGKSKEILGYSPKAVLKKIQETVIIQNGRFEAIYNDLLLELEKRNIHIINEKQLDSRQADFVLDYFHREVRTRLMPLLITRDSKMPDLTDDAIYFAILLWNSATEKRRHALLEIPAGILPRFVTLPAKKGTKYIIFIDDVIRFGMRGLFHLFQFDELRAFTFKLTRDAELDIADDISESYTDKITRSLQLRKKGPAVRLVYDREMPPAMLRMLTKKLSLGPDDVMIPGNRYHNFRDFMHFIPLNDKGNEQDNWQPLRHPDLPQGQSILAVMRKKDVMLSFPYHSFDHVIDLLREASLDPSVTSIDITLYRLARNSSVINALLNAARNGKSVTTVVELQARFDEEANIIWGKKLLDEGVRVIYGVPGLKVHAKLCLITRVRSDVTQLYAAVGTGNFNEETARVYTDHLILTSGKKITNDVRKAFNFFLANYRKDKFNHLVLSPFWLRGKITALIDSEIKNAQAGKKAYISVKINNLTDNEISDRLITAAEAGVRVRLIVRGMFSMIPDPGNENLKAVSIVDRYLEHSRFMIFCNGGDEQTFITSADIMPRNLDRRIEVMCPVFDPEIKKVLADTFEIQWNDNVKARLFDEAQSNLPVTSEGDPLRSQEEIRHYLSGRSPRITGTIH